VRKLVLRVLWPLTWPVRSYWIHSERKLGKKLLVDRVLKRLMPPLPAGFEAELPSGGKVFLHYREDIGLVVFMGGAFEAAESAAAVKYARPGTVAVDVGANVGMFTIPLALAVGQRGAVLAIEPSPDNVERLKSNVELNELDNVIIRPLAVADRPGELHLHLAADPAFHSTTTVAEARAVGETVVVRAETLDVLWEEAGSPLVSLVKVDTEGGELAVLRGAERLFERCRPLLLVEAKSDERILDEWLVPRGYSRTRPPGFAVGNFLCVPAGLPAEGP
jgi:FkbM family methyltransferase